MPSCTSFLATPAEVRSIQRRLASLRLAPSPAASHTVATPPAQSSSGSLISSTSELRSATFWLQDDRLPRTIRTAIRAGLWAGLVNSSVAGLGVGMRTRDPLAALKRLLSRTSFQLFLSILAFSTLYRSFLQAGLVARQRLLERLPSLVPKHIHRNVSEQNHRRNVDERTVRARLFARLVRLTKANATVPALAALLASLALTLLPTADFPVTGLALYLFTKAISSLYAEGRLVGSRLISWVPNWCDSGLLYAIGNGQLLWAFLFEPHAFPQGYGKIILARSSAYIPCRPPQLPDGVDWPSGQTIAEHVSIIATPTSTSSGFPSFTSPLLSSLTPSKHPTSPYGAINPVFDYSPAHPAHNSLMCAMLHPTEPSCKTTLLNHFKTEWIASARFAGVFALLASVAFRSKRWWKDPETEIFNVVVATLQSATVISGSIGTAWAMTCLLQQYLPRSFLPRARFFLNGFVAGVWILAVPKNKRRELGLYVARMSALSSWKILEKHNKAKSSRYGSHLLLAVALAIMAAMYESEGRRLQGSLKILSKKLFGDKLAGDTIEDEKRGNDGES